MKTTSTKFIINSLFKFTSVMYPSISTSIKKITLDDDKVPPARSNHKALTYRIVTQTSTFVTTCPTEMNQLNFFPHGKKLEKLTGTLRAFRRVQKVQAVGPAPDDHDRDSYHVANHGRRLLSNDPDVCSVARVAAAEA